jgi:diguanylate cyclase (GGDEF)-like protein
MRLGNIIIRRIMLIAVILISITSIMTANAQVILTKEEQDYIKSRNIIKAASLDGVAPLYYVDENGQVKGITKDVLDTISNMTGLVFSYQLYDTIAEVYNSDADIIAGIPYYHVPEHMFKSIPYLETETIIYMNSSVDPNELDDKKYAAIKDFDLPEGINSENVVYFKNREDCMDAVNAGHADYGYGNSYSVAFYTLRNNYKNIIMIPEKKEVREYCIGFLKDDRILLSIINKSISAIDDSLMRTMILKAATQIDRKVTVHMIIDAYGVQIAAVILFSIAIQLISIVRIIKAKNEIKIQNERYQMLAQISNEYFYEYYVKKRYLELSENSVESFGKDNLNKLKSLFNDAALKKENSIPIIELSLANGNMGYFKSVNSFIYDEKGRIHSIIGKLIDVSKEEAEKKELIKKSEIDGLTGIYNAITTRNLITDRIKDTAANKRDAMILIDCDKFKDVNDTYGHLQGDKVLVNVSNSLKQTFRKTDVIGRIGGDEFCVYMLDVPSEDFVVSKCQQFMELENRLNQEHLTTVSIGVSLLENEKSYDELFKKADKALYEAKNNGRNNIAIFHEYKY